MSFLSVGIDHERAPLALLERVTIPDEAFGKALGTLLANANIQEAVLVSTCLRTEVYAVIDRFHGAVDEITATLAEITNVDVAELQPLLGIQFDRGVSSHLFAVAAGLRSVVPGEFEVLGQLRRSLTRAEEEHAVGPELSELFQRALVAGRKVRNETAIARGTTSFAQATVDVIREELPGGFPRAVVVGAGQLASGVAKGLLAEPALESLVIVNRTMANAHEVQGELNDARVSVEPLTALHEALERADVAVAAVESPELLLHAESLRDRTAPLLLVDLGMPRVVDPALNQHPVVRRLDLDRLQVVVDHAIADRREEFDAAEEIVSTEIERYLDDRRSRGAAAIVSDLRDYLESIRLRELEKRSSELRQLTEEQRELIESITRSILAKVAHQPTMALKESAGTDRGLRMSEVLRSLFDL